MLQNREQYLSCWKFTEASRPDQCRQLWEQRILMPRSLQQPTTYPSLLVKEAWIRTQEKVVLWDTSPSSSWSAGLSNKWKCVCIYVVNLSIFNWEDPQRYQWPPKSPWLEQEIEKCNKQKMGWGTSIGNFNSSKELWGKGEYACLAEEKSKSTKGCITTNFTSFALLHNNNSAI